MSLTQIDTYRLLDFIISKFVDPLRTSWQYLQTYVPSVDDTQVLVVFRCKDYS